MNKASNYVVQGYEPASLFRFFEDISRIPRGSGNEQAISDYLRDFAKVRGIPCIQDALGNIFYRIPATAGREEDAPILLQGHMDMVCEKNGDTVHDFLRDPLSLYVDGKGFLRAHGTTLGGDNGIAVAAIMAIADGEMKSHPPIEALITVSEETGLDGATGFDYSVVTARTLLNLDSESEELVTVGCAGGVRSDMTLPAALTPFSGCAVEIALTGLKGGHSGESINSGRANANLLMGQLLSTLSLVTPLHLVCIDGGSKENAIPRECRAVIAVEEGLLEEVISAAEKHASAIKETLSPADADFCVQVSRVDPLPVMADAETSAAVVRIITSVQNGVLCMSAHIDGLVEWSRNLGVIRTENDAFNLVFSTRSAIEDQLDASVAELDAAAGSAGGTVRHYGRYPGWAYRVDSPIRDKYLRVCREELGIPARACAIHAGLECGIISSRLPGLDAISFGPDMHDIHSPAEALDLASCERFWKKLVLLLRE